MSKRQVFYLSIGIVFLGLFITTWGVLSDIPFLTVAGLLIFIGAGFFRTWWWIKARN